ncbi:MAG: flavin reductase family protein [Agarilytica sp.]
MRIDFSELSANQRYHIMTQVVVPRPIAWVLTDNGDTSYNLAPFSYFNGICSEPPLVMLSAGMKPTGEIKDTRLNILERAHMVIHIPSVGDAQAVSDTAMTLPHGESEIEKFGLSLQEEQGWALPRLRDSKVAMMCRYHQHTALGPNKQAIFFCEVTDVYIDDMVVGNDAKGRIKVDTKSLDPLSRLGANEYASFGEVFTLSRPL